MKVSWTTPKPSKLFIPLLRRKAAKKTLRIAEAVWQGVVDRTPVASGELRASWNLSLGAPSYETVGSPDSAPSGSGVSLPRPEMPQLQVPVLREAKYFVSNGKGYAGYVEYGSSTRPPALMLTRAVKAVDL